MSQALAEAISSTGASAPVLAGALAAIVAFLAAFPLCAAGRRMRILDQPGSRSSHTQPVPRTGGLAVLAGLFVAVVAFTGGRFAFLGSLVLLVGAVSFADDVFGLTFASRLAVQFPVTVSAVLVAGLALDELDLPYLPTHLPAWLGVAAAVVFAVGFTNFFNFMDGINGISACQGVLGGLTLSALLGEAGCAGPAVVAAAVAGACLGFAPHNFPNARLFLGDVGSTTVGFVLALLTLAAAREAHLPWVACAMPLGVFGYDATFTLFKRLLRRENPMRPHREHHYQLLIRCGWSHAKVTALQAALVAACCAAAAAYVRVGAALRAGLLAALLTVLVAYSVFVHVYFRRHRLDAHEGMEFAASAARRRRPPRRRERRARPGAAFAYGRKRPRTASKTSRY